MANRSLVIQISSNASGLNQGISNALAQLNRLNSSSTSIGQQMSGSFNSPIASLSRLTGGFLTVGAAISAVKEGLKITSDFQRMDASLRAVSTSSADYARTQNFLRATSDQYALSIEGISKAYVGFKANTNDTILKGAEAERIFLSVAKASAALQLSTEDTSGTLRAFGQMLSKGTVQSEELKGQVGERLYGAFQLAARAMGKTTMELNKMLQSGEVLAVDLLPKLATELDKSFGAAALNNINTMAGGFTRATDQMKLFVSEFSKTAGIDTFFGKLGNGLADYIKAVREAQRRGEGFLALNSARRVELVSQVDQVQTFRGAKPEVRAKMISDLTGQANGLRYRLANPGGMSGGDEEKARISLIVTEERIRNLRRANLGLLAAEHIEAKKINDTAGVAARIDIDKLNDRKDALAKQIANGKLNGENVAKLQAEFDKVSKQIENATASTKKPKQPRTINEAQFGDLNLNKRIADNLERQIQDMGGKAPQALYNQLSAIRAEIERIKDLTSAGPVNLGNNLAPLKGKGNFTDAFSALTNGPAAPKLPGVENLVAQIKENTDNIANAYKNMRDGIKGAAQDTAIDMASGLGEVIGGIATGQISILRGIIGLVTEFLSSYLSKVAQAKLIAGAALIAAGALSFDPVMIAQGARNLQGGALLKVASGAVKVVGNSIAAGFEKGGLFTNERTIRVAETDKARKGGGEWVTPVDRGAELVAKQLVGMGVVGGQASGRTSAPQSDSYMGSGMNVNVVVAGELTASGSDLKLVLGRTDKSEKIYGNG